MNYSHVLSNAIDDRSKTNGIHATYDSIEYMVNELYKPLPQIDKALYAGVGHGQDALMAMLSNKVRAIVGIDPYTNNQQDWVNLNKLIGMNNCIQSFKVYKTSLEDFLNLKFGGTKEFDAIVCCDVLHHIFKTGKTALRESLEIMQAVGLFYHLRRIGGRLIVSDVQRHGLRPLLSKHKILKTCVNYQSKQDWKEWDHAITEAGWKLKYKKTYVPYALRNLGFMLNNEIAQHTVCDRYFLYYE